jgi:replicative DNA helicase
MGLSGELGGNEALRIGEVSRLLKGLAKRFSAPVLAVHQFSRDIERRQDKRPQMSDMLFGGEQPADFIFGMVEKTDDTGTPIGNMIEVHVTKSRFSERGGMMNLYMKKPGLEFAGGLMTRVDLEDTYGEALA